MEVNRMTTKAQRLAAAVRAARQDRGMTQAELARAVGVHAQTIGNLERASHEAQPELVAKLTAYLKLDLSTSSLAARSAAEAIEANLLARMANMDEGQRLIFVGEVMRFVKAWHDEGQDEGGGG